MERRERMCVLTVGDEERLEPAWKGENEKGTGVDDFCFEGSREMPKVLWRGNWASRLVKRVFERLISWEKNGGGFMEEITGEIGAFSRP